MKPHQVSFGHFPDVVYHVRGSRDSKKSQNFVVKCVFSLCSLQTVCNSKQVNKYYCDKHKYDENYIKIQKIRTKQNKVDSCCCLPTRLVE